MSPQSSSNLPGEVTQKQRTNVYTTMLILSFVALCIGCLLLYLELNAYGPFPWWKAA